MSMLLEYNLRGLARMFYWLSMFLLLAGGGILIDPTHRRTGITIHIYITLAAFELYMWLLLLLARWQAGRGLASDAARSGIFVMVLQGLMFVAMNELHQAAVNQGLVATVVVVLLAAAKLPLARRWLGFALPAPLLVASGLWILMLAVPGLLLRQYREDILTQRAIGYLSCWAVAVLLAAHIPLAVWQARRGMRADGPAIRRWYVPWLISGVLGAMTILQLYATRWGMWVDWAYWYFSPIWLAAGAAALVLAVVSRRGSPLAGAALAAALVYALAAWGEGAPAGLPASWQQGLLACVVHPLYSPGIFLAAMLVVAGVMLHRRWLIALAVVLPAPAFLYAAARGLDTQLRQVAEWRYFPGVCVLVCAFIALGIGAALQRYRERHPAPPPAPPDSPPEPPDLPPHVADSPPASPTHTAPASFPPASPP